MDIKFSALQVDAVKEIVNIGAGNAATALSQMINKKIIITVPKVNFLALDKVPDIFGNPETLVSAIYLELLGDATGVVLFVSNKKDTNNLVDLLLGKKLGTTKILNDIGTSALKETGTILTGAYLNSIAKFLNMKLLMSSPSFVEDMAGAIIDNILIETSKQADYFFVIDTDLEIADEKIRTYFFFVPDVCSLKKMLNNMGVN